MFCLGLLAIWGSLISSMAMKTSLLRTLRVGRLSISNIHSFVPSCLPSSRYNAGSRLMSTKTGSVEGGMKETGGIGRRRLIGSRLLRGNKPSIMPKVVVDALKEEEENEVDEVEEGYEEDDEGEGDYDDSAIGNISEEEGDFDSDSDSDTEQVVDRSSQYAVPEVDESTNEFSRLGLLSGIVKGLASQGFTTPTPVQVGSSQSNIPVKYPSQYTTQILDSLFFRN